MRNTFLLLIFLVSLAKSQTFGGFDFTSFIKDTSYKSIPDGFFIPLPEDSIGLIKRRKEWIFCANDFKTIPATNLLIENQVNYFELKLHETPWNSKILMMEEYSSPVSRAWHLYSYPDLKWLYSFEGGINKINENLDSLKVGIYVDGALGSIGDIVFYKDKSSKTSSLFFLDEKISTIEKSNFYEGKAKRMSIKKTCSIFRQNYNVSTLSFIQTSSTINIQNVLELHSVNEYSLILYKVVSNNPYHPSKVFSNYFETAWIRSSNLVITK